jgi:hypothetical protein
MAVADIETDDAPGFRFGPIVAGLIVLLLGVGMFLGTTGAVNLHFGQMVGPLVLIVMGCSMVLDRPAAFVFSRRARRGGDGERRRRGGPGSGIWLIGVGAWMAVSQNHIFGLTYHTSWPLFIVLSGIIMVIRGFK